MHELVIITKSGNVKSKLFSIDTHKDIEYMSGYIQACKDKGAKVFSKRDKAFEALQEYRLNRDS